MLWWQGCYMSLGSARGKSNEEIAMILGNKRPTIATHIKRIFAKLDVSDRASAAVKGLKFGLINV